MHLLAVSDFSGNRPDVTHILLMCMQLMCLQAEHAHGQTKCSNFLELEGCCKLGSCKQYISPCGTTPPFLFTMLTDGCAYVYLCLGAKFLSRGVTPSDNRVINDIRSMHNRPVSLTIAPVRHQCWSDTRADTMKASVVLLVCVVAACLLVTAAPVAGMSSLQPVFMASQLLSACAMPTVHNLDRRPDQSAALSFFKAPATLSLHPVHVTSLWKVSKFGCTTSKYHIGDGRGSANVVPLQGWSWPQ